jgi:hypothetical protein
MSGRNPKRKTQTATSRDAKKAPTTNIGGVKKAATNTGGGKKQQRAVVKNPKAKAKQRDNKQLIATIQGDYTILPDITAFLSQLNKIAEGFEQVDYTTEETKNVVYKAIFDSYLAHIAMSRLRVDEDEFRSWALNEIADDLPVAKKHRRPAYGPSEQFRISSNVHTWESVKQLFHKQWKCVYDSTIEEGTDHDLAVYHKNNKTYSFYCPCQKKLVEANRYDDNIVIIRFHNPFIPDPKTGLFTYGSSVKKTLMTASNCHFERRTVENDDLEMQEMIDDGDLKPAATDLKPLALPILADAESANTLLALSQDTNDNITPEDLSYLKVDVDTLRSRMHGEFFLIDKEYAKDPTECQRLQTINELHYKRSFNADTRPSIAAIGTMPNLTKTLRSLLFNDKGAINPRVMAEKRKDSLSIINFNQPVADNRLMFTIDESEDPNSVFGLLKTLLAEYGIIDSNVEEMYDVSILIGGTKDQQVHFDNPRIFGGYSSKDDSPLNNFVYKEGHEINRELYNKDLHRKLGPASIILDVTTRLCGVSLGVLKEFIIPRDVNKASIKCGRDGEEFRVVSSNTKGTIINVEGAGVIFAGDFPHYGVKNVEEKNQALNENLMKFVAGIGTTISKKSYLLLEQTNNLNELSRLFLKVKPRDNEFRIYNLEAVGTFTGKFNDYPL